MSELYTLRLVMLQQPEIMFINFLILGILFLKSNGRQLKSYQCILIWVLHGFYNTFFYHDDNTAQYNAANTVLALGLCIVYFKRYDITIHMQRYSICINDTFYLVLDQKHIICPQISCEFGNFNDQNTLNLRKNVSYEVSFN